MVCILVVACFADCFWSFFFAAASRLIRTGRPHRILHIFARDPVRAYPVCAPFAPHIEFYVQLDHFGSFIISAYTRNAGLMRRFSFFVLLVVAYIFVDSRAPICGFTLFWRILFAIKKTVCARTAECI